MKYKEWEYQAEISPISPEAGYATEAWNTAINECIEIIKSAKNAENNIENFIILITTELELIKE